MHSPTRLKMILKVNSICLIVVRQTSNEIKKHYCEMLIRLVLQSFKMTRICLMKVRKWTYCFQCKSRVRVNL